MRPLAQTNRSSLTAQPVLFINSALPTSHLAWSSSGKDVRFLNRLRRLLGKTDEVDRKFILYMTQKMARR